MAVEGNGRVKALDSRIHNPGRGTKGDRPVWAMQGGKQMGGKRGLAEVMLAACREEVTGSRGVGRGTVTRWHQGRLYQPLCAHLEACPQEGNTAFAITTEQTDSFLAPKSGVMVLGYRWMP